MPEGAPSSPEIPESAVKRRKTDSELSTTNRVVSALNDRYVPAMDVSSSRRTTAESPKRQRFEADRLTHPARLALMRSRPRPKKRHN